MGVNSPIFFWENTRIVAPLPLVYYLFVRTNNNNKINKGKKMSKSESKNGKCKNCSNTHDGECNKKAECDKKMCDK